MNGTTTDSSNDGSTDSTAVVSGTGSSSLNSRSDGFRRRSVRMCLYGMTVVMLLLAKAIFDLRDLQHHQKLKSLKKKKVLHSTGAVAEKSFTLEDAVRMSHEVENVKEVLNISTPTSMTTTEALENGTVLVALRNESTNETIMLDGPSSSQADETHNSVQTVFNSSKLEETLNTSTPTVTQHRSANESETVLLNPAGNETRNDSAVLDTAASSQAQATHDGPSVVHSGPGPATQYPVVDVLSIGSISRLNYLTGQRSSWASHPSIRWFLNATERDDTDPYCFRNATHDDISTQIQHCRNLHSTPFLSQYKYFIPRWVLRKANPTGWWCAQVRPGSGMGKLGRFYREKLNIGSNDGKTENTLPDFALVVDDDTMYQMELFQKAMNGVDPHPARVWAGCLTVLRATPPHRFSPFGGAGTIWSRGALERMLQPIWCNNTTKQPTTIFQQQVCARIEENLIHEQALWVDGMSVSDLMERVFNHYPNCFFSDWLLGHFVNYYYLSEVWPEDYGFRNVSEARFHLYYDAFQFFHEPTTPNATNTGTTCETTTDAKTASLRCSSSSPICHYVSPDTMTRVSSEWLTKSPGSEGGAL